MDEVWHAWEVDQDGRGPNVWEIHDADDTWIGSVTDYRMIQSIAFGAEMAGVQFVKHALPVEEEVS